MTLSEALERGWGLVVPAPAVKAVHRPLRPSDEIAGRWGIPTLCGAKAHLCQDVALIAGVSTPCDRCERIRQEGGAM